MNVIVYWLFKICFVFESAMFWIRPFSDADPQDWCLKCGVVQVAVVGDEERVPLRHRPEGDGGDVVLPPSCHCGHQGSNRSSAQVFRQLYNIRIQAEQMLLPGRNRGRQH